jgi:hypothetical protein
MKAQRMAWDDRVWAAWRESMFCGSRRSARPIGERTSISANDGPCNQHFLRWLAPTRSESRTPTGVVVCSLRHMTARCIDVQRDGPISAAPATPSARLAQRSQRWSRSELHLRRRMSACGRPGLTARSLSKGGGCATLRNTQQRLNRPARPGHPPFED